MGKWGILGCMRVGICYTKNSPNGKNLIGAFRDGVMAHDDQYEDIKNVTDAKIKLPKCDVSFQVCESTGGGHAPEDNLRKQIAKIQNNMNKRRIILDTGFLPVGEPHHSIGFDGIKGAARFHNENSPPDRKNLRKIKLHPWTDTEGHILIICQTFRGAGLRHMKWEEARDYFLDLPKRIRQYTDRPIIFRLHPNQGRESNSLDQANKNSITDNIPDVKFVTGKRSNSKHTKGIEHHFPKTYCTITRTSAGCLDGILKGIPSISEDECNIANPVCDRDLSNIENILKPDRDQWVNDLCYAEWSVEDMKKGRCWKHLRSHVNKHKRK
jgi:hypothetical protein